MIGVLYFTLITFSLALSIVILDNVINKRKSKNDKILELLPGYNCGACGYGSCKGMADELLNNKDAIETCKILKNKEEILKLIK